MPLVGGLVWVWTPSFAWESPLQLKTPHVSRCWRCPPCLPAPIGLSEEKNPVHPTPVERSPPKSPWYIRGCQSPTPVSFLAQVGQPGGEGRRKAPAVLTSHHRGKGDPRLLAAGAGVPRASDVLQHPGVDAGHLGKGPRLGRRGGLGRTESLGRWAEAACPQLPSSCLFCLFF